MATKVLVVDDSALMRKLLSDMINSDPNLEVVGTAFNGVDAITKARTLQPNVITMDVEMPEKNGIEATKEILKISKIPVIMVSATTEAGSHMTMDAMNAGAVDFIVKPEGRSDDEIEKLKTNLIEKITFASKAKVLTYTKTVAKSRSFHPTSKKIIVIGSSTGGPQTLEALLTELPESTPVPILIVQHMPPLFTKSLADRLNKICQIKVREAADGDKVENGVALIAPGNYHMEFTTDANGNGIVKMNQEPKELGVRPNANRLFKSVASYFKENTIGVVLTGMGTDGTEGSKEIKAHNGTIISESESTSIIYGMPKSVFEAGYVDMVVDLPEIAVALLQILEL